MPRISVTDRDISWYYRQRPDTPGTVFVPGIATFGPTDRPVLCDYTNFTNVFGTSAIPDIGDISYDSAASFIKSGFSVLFQRFVTDGAKAASYTISDDSDNSIVFSAKYVGSFGNRLSVRLSGNYERVAVFVYLDGTTLLENLVFVPADPNDVQKFNYDSQYLSVSVTGTATSLPITSGPHKLSGGTDYEKGNGDDVASEADTLLSTIASQLAVEGVFDHLKDPYQYDIDLISSVGWPNIGSFTTNGSAYTTNSVGYKIDALLTDLASSLGTAVYFIDGASSWDDATMYGYCSQFNISYAAGIGPWGYAQLVSTGELRLLPGSYALINSWANSCAAGNPIWMAPAGTKRATLGSFYKETARFVGKTTLDMWQNHEYVVPGDYKVNPIMEIRQYGYVVYGNSTLLQVKTDGSTSQLQALSTRVLCNQIKRQALRISLTLQFDQMARDLYSEFRALMTDYMEQLRYNNALYSYQIVLSENTVTSADLNERTVPVIIRISPIPAAENFDITLEIAQAGIIFTDDTDETEVA